MTAKKKKVHRFKKGVSANPRGRPKGSKNKSSAELHAILDKIVDFDRLILALAKKAYRGNHHCAKLLLEHRFGKPRQSFELDPEGLDAIGKVLIEVVNAKKNTEDQSE